MLEIYKTKRKIRRDTWRSWIRASWYNYESNQ